MCVKINGQFTLTAMMVPLCISLTVILFTASRAIASDTNTTNKNIYYETRYIQDEKKAEALWLELNDQQYVNTSMTFSFAEATKALEQSNEKYKVYGLRRVQNISFDFLLFGETVRTVQLFANGLLMLAEQLYPKQLTEQPYFASVQPDFDLYPAEVVSFDFIRWFQNDSQLTVTWENMEFKPENSNFTFYTFQTTLFKTGDIVIVVKSITNKHTLRNVTVTLMDGFILPNEAIHPYPHHSFKFVYENISNWSLIYMKPWPTCLNQKNLNSCLLPNRSLWAPDSIYDTNCSWCPSANFCVSLQDRILRKWTKNNCDREAASYEVPTETKTSELVINLIIVFFTIFGFVLFIRILMFDFIVVFMRKLRRRGQTVASNMEEQETAQTVMMFQWKKRIVISAIETQSSPGDGDSLNIPIVSIEKHKTICNSASLSSGETSTSEYDIPRDDLWEFPRQSLTFGPTLGEGAFGKVVQAEARGILKPDTVSTVAVKMLREDHLDSEIIALVTEVEVMKMNGKHDSILNLLGVCSQDGPLYVIVEFAEHNNLRDFLRKNRPLPEYTNVLSSDSSRVVLTEEDLVSFASQVAKGMQYLHSRKCLHRDLAARNILVSNGHILKIADFGLARYIHTKDYYRIASQGVLPFKWMAPESLSQHLFKYKSDVWSFGVLLWEIMTLGEAPYPSVHDWESMVSFLDSGRRLEKPSCCSDEIYDMMQECWNYEATDRPQFCQLASKIGNGLNSN